MSIVVFFVVMGSWGHFTCHSPMLFILFTRWYIIARLQFSSALFFMCMCARTHTCIYGLRGLSIGVMVFILYKLYFLSPYNNPTPKPTPYRKLLAIFEFHKTPLCMFFKPFVLQGHRKCPHKPHLCCSTHVIIHICVLINHLYQYTHTHTQTETGEHTPTPTSICKY